MDFALILVVATALSGAIWAVDAVLLRPRRIVEISGASASGPTTAIAEPLVVEYARSFFPILLVVLLIRSFLFEPFRIPSSSMLPTLLVGDFIFVNKYAYGLRLPVLNTKILEIGSPQRGEVIVFRLPADPSTNYIKRLVGLPGDKITYVNKQIFVNDQPVPIEVAGAYTGIEQPGATLVREQLGVARHDVLWMPNQMSNEGTYFVPDGYLFMMGDNRDNSQDSRYPQVGFVPVDNVVGRAVRIWMSWDFRDFPSAPNWRRIGNQVR